MTDRTEPPMPPRGARTLTELVDAAERVGYADQFDAVLGDDGAARLVCRRCDAVARPAEVTVVWAARTEGASDPDDELYVAVLELPCGARGVYVASYGPAAGAADAAVLPELPQPVFPAAPGS